MNNHQTPKLMSSYAALMPSNVPMPPEAVTVPRILTSSIDRTDELFYDKRIDK